MVQVLGRAPGKSGFGCCKLQPKLSGQTCCTVPRRGWVTAARVQVPGSGGLTSHSSRRRFAARLNSGVRCHGHVHAAHRNSILSAGERLHCYVIHFPRGELDPNSTELDSFRSEWYSSHLRAMSEPILAAPTTTRTYRFTWLRSFHHPIAIRIVSGPGQPKVIAVELNGAGGATTLAKCYGVRKWH